MKQVVEEYAKGVAKYKKEHRNGSPVQAQAVQNRNNNRGKEIALNSSSIIGGILSLVPHPFFKVAGGILKGATTIANALVIDNEHAEDVAIKILIEVANPEFAK